MLRRSCARLALCVALAGCAGSGALTPNPPSPASPALLAQTSSKIHHVVIIVQENRSVDDLFNGFPGADTVRSGLNSKGERVALQPISLTAPYDLGHTHQSFVTEYDGGKLDGFDRDGSRCFGIGVCIPEDVSAYGYVPSAQSKPYFVMGMRYAFADRMFQTNQGPSFPAHQYLVSGTSAIADGSSLRAADNPFTPDGASTGGCDSPAGSLVALIDPAGDETQSIYPCFDRLSMMQLLDAKSLSWRYYEADPGAGLWNAPDAVLPIRKSREFGRDVVAPSVQVLSDIAKGRLADVVWVTPTALASDHARATNGSGPSWVAAVVNAVGKSQYWKDTAIFVTWDDWGGWYDHVAPPVYNSYELSFRVPLIVISPYAKNHYVSHVQHEFGSILKFTEKVFGLPSLHATDVRADDLFDCFDFSKKPTAFTPIPAPYPPKYFRQQPLDTQSPDDDSSYASPEYRSIYGFGQGAKLDDGRAPVAHLIAIGKVLYGTTQLGGTTNGSCAGGCGTLYAISAAGAERILYRFKGGSDGAGPVAGLVTFDAALYGTTAGGGSETNCAGGCGTVFRAGLGGKGEAPLYRFNGGSDGAHPVGGLIVANGELYGTTQYGGAHTGLCPSGCGTVFRMSEAGKSEEIVHAFRGGEDGSGPLAGLIADDGALYGTTQYGGTSTPFCEIGCGTVFKIDLKTGQEQVVYRFEFASGTADGAYPAARLLAFDGALYGTTLGGGSAADGTVFRVDTNGTERVLHSFSCCVSSTDGIYPLDGLIAFGGTLYGTTRHGGAHRDGTVFSIAPSGAESVLYSFSGKPDGAQPLASLAVFNGAFYGTTLYGGPTGEGTVFTLHA